LGVLDQLTLSRQGISTIESEDDPSRFQRADNGQKDPAVLGHQDCHPVSYTPAEFDDAMCKVIGGGVLVGMAMFPKAARDINPRGMKARGLLETSRHGSAPSGIINSHLGISPSLRRVTDISVPRKPLLQWNIRELASSIL